MAIAFATSTSIYQGTATGSQNLSVTVSGTNPVLVVGTRTYDGAGVSGITYNGTSMVQVGSTQTLGTDEVKAWILHNPTSGANTLTATISPNRRIEIYAVVLSGGEQVSAADATQWATGTGTSAGATVTTATDNAWSVAFTFANGASGTVTSGTNCTAVSQIADRGSAGYGGPKTPAGTFNQTLNWPSSGGWGFFQVAVAPEPVVGPVNVKTWDGVAAANIKTLDGVTYANIKSINGIT